MSSFLKINRHFALSLIVATTAHGAGTTNPAPDHHAKYGYSIEAPPAWNAIDPGTLQKTAALIQKPGATGSPIWDAGYEPSEHTRPMAYPYLLVQVMPYSLFGMNRQINEDEFPSVVSAITGAKVNDIKNEKLSDAASKLVGDITLGQPQLQSDKRRFLFAIDLNVAGIGKVHGLMAGYFGSKELVQVAVYDRAEAFPQTEPAARAAIDSFQFDPAEAYSTALAAANPTPTHRWNTQLITSVVGAMAAVAVVSVLNARKKKSGGA